MPVDCVPIPVDMRDIADRITMTVSLIGMREFRFRLWIGLKLLKLAARKMRMKFEAHR